MSVLDAVILGLIQGFSEFLPISSSGHLVMAQELLDVRMPGVFLEVMLHTATLLSVVVVYRAKLWAILTGVLRRDAQHLRYAGYLLLASIPAGIVGLGLEDTVEAAFDTPTVTGVMLLVTGLILYSTRWATRRQAVPVEPDEHTDPAALRRDEPTLGNAVAMGIAQAFALLPGISRSGTTITAGLWGRLSGEAAAEFSFLMSVIAVGGATLLQLGDLGDSVRATGGAALAAGFTASLISGIVAIKALVWLLRRQEFHKFAYYVWIVGALFLVYLAR